MAYPYLFFFIELHKDEKAIEYQDKFIFGANHSTNTSGLYQDVVFILSKGEIMIKKTTVVITALFALGLAGWASTQLPRDVDTIQIFKKQNTDWSKVTESDGNSLEITYAEMSMGFDSSCNPFQSFSDELNDCSQLPGNV